MIYEWTLSNWPAIGLVIVCCVVVYIAILILTRIVGLRSFSKMSAADFAMTIAVGSLFASTISSPSPPLVLGLTAIATLYVSQWSFAVLRKKSKRFSKLVDNEPLLLMNGREILDDNLKRANVTRADLFGKLREANAINYDHVLAVVFETTGDISVLHSDDENAMLETELLQNVVGFQRLDDRLTGRSSSA